MRKIFPPIAALVFCAAAPLVSRGAGIPWKSPSQNFTFRVQDGKLPQVLRDYGLKQGVKIIVSDKVEGEVSGNFDQVPPGIFLDQMAKAYGLTWFYDGTALYIYRADEIKSEMLPIPAAAVTQVTEMLEALGTSAGQGKIEPLANRTMALVSGPPRFFELVSSLAANVSLHPAQAEVRVFPLKNAWAYDLRFDFRGGAVTVPGVATVLSSIIAGGGAAAPKLSVGGGIGSSVRASAVEKVSSSNGVNQSTQDTRQAEQQQGTATSGNVGAPGATTGAGGSGLPQIYPEVRLNAVIVRDLPANLAQYATLIAELDKPTAIVEINAAVVDVNANNSRSLGTDFLVNANLGSGRGAIQFGNDTGTDTSGGSGQTGTGTQTNSVFGTGGPIANAATLIPGLGGTISPLIISNAGQFLARIRFLEEKGVAKLLSRPSVLTSDNVEATLRNDESFFVRVAGERDVELFNVSAGTTLQVTPHVIREGRTTKIKLVLSIRDGSITAQTVDQIPIVSESNINTQATILENQSLLIGGLMKETVTHQTRGIPGLGRIPVLGYVFKRETSEKTRTERMFLITPRVVSLAYDESVDPTALFKSSFDKEIQLQDDKTVKKPDTVFAPKTRAARLVSVSSSSSTSEVAAPPKFRTTAATLMDASSKP